MCFPSVQDINSSIPLDVPTSSCPSLGLALVNAKHVNLTLADYLLKASPASEALGPIRTMHLIFDGWLVADFDWRGPPALNLVS